MQHGVAGRQQVVHGDTAPLRRLFTRSLVVSSPLPAGTVLRGEHLAIKKPGTGLSPDRLNDVIGRRLSRSVERDHVLMPADVEGLS